MINKLGGRKVVLGMIMILIGAAISAWLPGGLNENLLKLLTFVAIGFFAGNSMEHLSDALGKKSTKIDTSEIELDFLPRGAGKARS